MLVKYPSLNLKTMAMHHVLTASFYLCYF